MTRMLTRRELAQQALAGTMGALLSVAQPARAQVVDPLPAAPPVPLPPKPTQNALPMPNSTMPTQSAAAPETTAAAPETTAAAAAPEGELLTRLVPVAAGYTLSETQAKEVAAQLKGYPGGFAKARAYALSDDIGPAFAAVAPVRKEHVK